MGRQTYLELQGKPGRALQILLLWGAVSVWGRPWVTVCTARRAESRAGVRRAGGTEQTGPLGLAWAGGDGCGLN